MPRRDNRFGDILDTARAVKQTVFGMQMQMDEVSHRRTSLYFLLYSRESEKLF
jgi:hypothetical protein